MTDRPFDRRRFLAATAALSIPLAGCPGQSSVTENTPTEGKPSPSESTPTQTPTATLTPAETQSPTDERPTATDAPGSTAALTPPSDGGVTAFGSDVAIADGTTLVGGVPAFEDSAGQPAMAFERTGGPWERTGSLAPGTDRARGLEHWPVAVDGNHALLGGQEETAQGEWTGTIYFFERDASGWQRTGRHRFDPTARRTENVRSVALAGDRALVGLTSSYGMEVDHPGTAVVFERGTDGWTRTATLEADGDYERLGYGHAVDLTADAAIVGTFEANVVVVFEHDADGWRSVSKLGSDDDQAFGKAVALAGDRALVGDPWANTPDGNDAGVAYVFQRQDAGWERATTLTGAVVAEHDEFGAAVALSGDIALVGDPMDRERRGAVDRFERGDDGWDRVAQLRAPNADPDDDFGDAVALTDGTALVGAPGDGGRSPAPGAAYVFEP